MPWSKVGTTALATILALSVGAVSGHVQWGIWAFAGAFTSFYVADQPYRRRAAVLFWVMLGMAAAEVVGAAATLWWLSALVLAAAGYAATYLAGRYELRLPAGFMFLLVACISSAVPSVAQTPERVAFVLVGGAMAWIIGMSTWLVEPAGPEIRLMRTAYDSLAAFLGAIGTPRRMERQEEAASRLRAATEAVRAMRQGPEPMRRRLAFMAARGEAIFLSAVALAAERDRPLVAPWAPYMRRLGTLADPAAPPPPPSPQQQGSALERAFASVVAETAAAFREGEVPRHDRASDPDGRAPGIDRTPPFLTTASLRNGIAIGVAVVAAHLVGITHPYWAPLTVAAVLQGHTVETQTQRAVERVVGSLAGVGLTAALIAALHPSVWLSLALVVVLQALMRILLVKNYGLAVAPMTAFALLLVRASKPVPAPTLELPRLWDTLIGVALALAATYLLWARASSRKLPRVLSQTLADEADMFARVARRPAGGPSVEAAHLEAGLARLEAVAKDALSEVPPSRTGQRLLPSVEAAERLGYALIAADGGAIDVAADDAVLRQAEHVFDTLADTVRGADEAPMPDVSDLPDIGPVGRELRTLAKSLNP